MKLSVVIPAHNEAKRIAKTIVEIENYFEKKNLDFHLVLADDGSSDGTSSVVENSVRDKSRVKIIRHLVNLGKGAAIRTGMINSDGDYILFMDADSSTKITEFDKFMPLIERQIPVIIGSRKAKGSLVEKRQSFAREFFGRGFTVLSNLMLGTGFSDFTCGFKCFRKDAAKKIASLQTIDNWSFDSEILFLARKLGLEVEEVPVRWVNDPASNVRIARDIITSFWGLLRINANRFSGKYDEK